MTGTPARLIPAAVAPAPAISPILDALLAQIALAYTGLAMPPAFAQYRHKIVAASAAAALSALQGASYSNILKAGRDAASKAPLEPVPVPPPAAPAVAPNITATGAAVASSIITGTESSGPTPITVSSMGGINNLSDEDFRHKIMMSEFYDNSSFLKGEISRRNAEIFKDKVFSQNEFKQFADTNYGGIPPDAAILSLIQSIGSSVNDEKNLIENYGEFLHTRVGTLLAKLEMNDTSGVLVRGNTDFKSGNLIAHSLDGVDFEVVVFKDTVTPAVAGAVPSEANIIKIKRGSNNKVERTELKKVPIGELHNLNDKLKQTYKPSMKLSEDELIETYEINF